MIYRDLICKDESELPMMYYIFRKNGRFVEECPANNDNDCYVSSAYNGKLEIWIEAHDLARDRRSVSVMSSPVNILNNLMNNIARKSVNKMLTKANIKPRNIPYFRQEI